MAIIFMRVASVYFVQTCVTNLLLFSVIKMVVLLPKVTKPYFQYKKVGAMVTEFVPENERITRPALRSLQTSELINR